MEEQVVETGEATGEAAAPIANDISNAQPAEEQSVPLSALQAERKERQKLSQDFEMLKEHMALIQANQPPQRQQEPADEMERLSDDDVLTVGEAKKFISKLDQQYKMSIQELAVTQKYPDYQEVVTKHLPEVIKQNPSLRQTLANDPNRYELAYFLSKKSDSYQGQSQQTAKHADAERIVQNSQRAGTLSAVGQASGGVPDGRYKSMSDSEFMKEVNKNMGYF